MLKAAVTYGTGEDTDVSVGLKRKKMFLMVYIYSTLKIEIIMQSVRKSEGSGGKVVIFCSCYPGF